MEDVSVGYIKRFRLVVDPIIRTNLHLITYIIDLAVDLDSSKIVLICV